MDRNIGQLGVVACFNLFINEIIIPVSWLVVFWMNQRGILSCMLQFVSTLLVVTIPR